MMQRGEGEGRGGANQIRESNKYKFETDEVILAGLTRSDRTADSTRTRLGLYSDSPRLPRGRRLPLGAGAVGGLGCIARGLWVSPTLAPHFAKNIKFMQEKYRISEM